VFGIQFIVYVLFYKYSSSKCKHTSHDYSQQ
jgi:hypothetical protein